MLFDKPSLLALLVNESRARNTEKSGDVYSRSWVEPKYQGSISSLWNEYANTVYPLDDVVLSVRTRIIMSALQKYANEQSTVVLFPCGFVSYPYFLSSRAKYIEVDVEELVEYKRTVATKNQESGSFPTRRIDYISCDFHDSLARKKLLSDIPRIGNIVFVMEGISYYLEEKEWWDVINEIIAMCATGDVVIFDYWPHEERNRKVYDRFRLFCNRHMVMQIERLLFLKKHDIYEHLAAAKLSFQSVLTGEKTHLGSNDLMNREILNDSCVVAVIK